MLTTEPVARGVRRILVAQLDHILDTLARQSLSDDDVHSIRKQLKRVRASLRLLREALGAAEFQRLNRSVRDAARPLSHVRDAAVLLQALDNVLDHAGSSRHVSTSDELRQSLQQELRLNRSQLQKKDIDAIRKRLDTTRSKLQALSESRLDKVSIDAAIKHADKKVRKAFKVAKRKPVDENLHEWRKQVKYEFNQLELLQPLKPKRIDAIIRRARKLSDRLGDDHDLAILHERIVAQSSPVGAAGADDRSALLKVLKALRDRLQRKALRLGKKLKSEDVQALEFDRRT